MVDRLKVPTKIDVKHPTAVVLHDARSQVLKGLMRRPTRPEPERAISKVLLVNGFQQENDRSLSHLVLEGGNAQGTLRAIRFRNLRTTDRRGLITAGLDPLEEIPKVLLKTDRIVLGRLPVDSDGAILARQLVCVPKPFLVEVVVQ
jgi:hypothetical protein